MYKFIIRFLFKFTYTLISSNLVTWNFRTRMYNFFGSDIGYDSLIGYGCDLAGNISNLKIGKNSYLNSHGYLQLEAPIVIGSNVRIASFVRILTRWHPIENSYIRRTFGRDHDIPCYIEDGCWIGVGVTILPKVNIAQGCVIAAGSVVTHSTKPNGLYAGVPAVRKKDLPTDNNPMPLLDEVISDIAPPAAKFDMHHG